MFRNRHDRSSESVALGVCHAITIALLTLEDCVGKIQAVDRSFWNEAKSGNAGYFACCPRIAFRLHTLSVLRFRFECPCSCRELPARGVSGVDRARKSAARQIKGGIAHKKAQKTRKLFVNFVPLCGYSLRIRTAPLARTGADARLWLYW